MEPEDLYNAKKSQFLQMNRAVEHKQHGDLGIIMGPSELQQNLHTQQVWGVHQGLRLACELCR